MLDRCEIMCLPFLQKNPENLDILAFWLANTSRLLHDMKQYSGDRVSGRSTLLILKWYLLKLCLSSFLFVCCVHLHIYLF